MFPMLLFDQTSPSKSSKCYDDVNKTQYWLNVGPPLPALAQQFTLNQFDFYVAAFFWERLYENNNFLSQEMVRFTKPINPLSGKDKKLRFSPLISTRNVVII